MDSFIMILFTAGGVGTLAAIFNGIKSQSQIKQESESILHARLNDTIRDGAEREEALLEARKKEEERSEMLRMERDEQAEKAAYYRRLLIANGILSGDAKS